MSQFQIRKDNFSKCRIVESTISDSQQLKSGEIRVKIERFALTANNITYAVVGDKLGYWQFFPPVGDDAQGWGVIPVWGFAEITESTVTDLPVGERLFGYFPPAEKLTMAPVNVSGQRFIDGAAHRLKLPPGYNNYRRISSEPGYDSSMDNERMLLWPLFITSYCIWDQLQDKDWYGAQQVIVVSASSKTSIGLAYALHEDSSSPRTVGITSARNLELVESLGLYDDSVSYDELLEIDANISTVVVDMSGNSELLGKLHRHFGDNLKYCINVGVTHWEDTGTSIDIVAERSEFFFAPGHIQKRIKDWGPEEFEKKTSTFILETTKKCQSWLKLKKVKGLTGLPKVYEDVSKGRVAPNEGIVIEL